jgi:pyruvate dehydrogenase E2 component (dihydrolipoamide acetyltransferase)
VTQHQIREFVMPDVGEGLADAEIIKWFVQPGDRVHDGMIVCEVETAKAAVELPIPFDGVVDALHFPEGTSVDVGRVIISVATAAEQAAEPAAGTPAPQPVAQTTASQAPAAETPAARTPVLVGYGSADGPAPRRRRAAAPAVPVETAAAAEQGRALAKPPVRKLARDLGVDLSGVVPTGADGVISREDVHAAAAVRAPQPSQPAEAVPAVQPGSVPGETRIPIKGVRRATAQAMTASAFSAPHVTEFVTVDVTRTMALIQQLRSDPELAGVRITPLLMVARALLVAIRRHPEINAAWDELNQEIVRKHHVNLGIAAATPRGLIVPNIKDAASLTLPQLATALAELVATAREGRTTPAAMSGGTVTITNIGVFGVDTGTPILNPGEAAILAVGRITPQPWVHKGRVEPRQVTTLALSFDHRLVDGELGSKVLADTAALLEHPKRFLTWA